MTDQRTYLDHNASVPLRPEAREAAIAALTCVGNPSSVHQEGRRARAIVDEARALVAQLVNAAPAEVVFTSGATESNVWALSQADVLAYGETEHASVLASVEARAQRGAAVRSIPVLQSGVVDIEALARIVAEDRNPQGRRLVALQMANNETGIVQPVGKVAMLGRELGFDVHTDAVQAAGRIDIDMTSLGVASLSLSAHKIGGPKGVGALVLGAGREMAPLIPGGGQERRRRGGTENVAAIAGFGAAAKAALAELEEQARIAARRDQFEDEVIRAVPETVIIGRSSPRLANTSALALPGRAAETLVIKLDLAGFAVSAGAACSSGKVGRSHVLQAMGLEGEVAKGAVRVSIGALTTAADLAAFVVAWKDLAGRSRLAA